MHCCLFTGYGNCDKSWVIAFLFPLFFTSCFVYHHYIFVQRVHATMRYMCTTNNKSIVFVKYIVSNLFDFLELYLACSWIALVIVLYISSFSFLKSLSISWYYFLTLSFEILPVTAYSLDWKNHIVNLMWHSGQYNLSRFYRLSPSQTGLTW